MAFFPSFLPYHHLRLRLLLLLLPFLVAPAAGQDDAELMKIFNTIQNLKKTITCDPTGVTKTWTDRPEDICPPGDKRRTYKGFLCEVPPGKTKPTVASIDFNGFGLCSASIGNFLPNFTDLALFHVNSNNFSGPIPASIAMLPFLVEIDISNNKFSGPFPSGILGVKTLRFVDIRYNSFSGSVPKDVFLSLPDVEAFFLNDNNFAQALPDSLASTKAEVITFANNQFTGAIPRTIGNAAKTLKEVLFLNNNLSGRLPNEIGSLSNAIVFDASHNHLEGPIPDSFAGLTKIEQLNLAVNRLQGAIPEVLCVGALGKLKNLNLSYNYFTKIGPQCQKLAEKKLLNVRRNCIPGMLDQRLQSECAASLLRHANYPNSSRKLSYTLPLLKDEVKSRPLLTSLASSSSSSSSLGDFASYRALQRNR